MDVNELISIIKDNGDINNTIRDFFKQKRTEALSELMPSQGQELISVILSLPYIIELNKNQFMKDIIYKEEGSKSRKNWMKLNKIEWKFLYLSECNILCNLVSGKLEMSGTNVIYEKAESQGIVLSKAKIRQINWKWDSYGKFICTVWGDNSLFISFLYSLHRKFK